MKTIAVLNAKGGCGKTTLSTHLAVALSRSGVATTLADLDRQKSALRWHALRPEGAFPVKAVDWTQNIGGGLKKSARVVLDCPAALRGARLEDIVATAEAVVVPVLPSVFDEMATARFLGHLARIKSLRKGLHVIANRVRAGSRAMARLAEFAENRDLIFTAILSERALYGDLATRGLTLFDLNTKAAAALIEEWMPLLTALED